MTENEKRLSEIIKEHTETDRYGNVIILKGLDNEAYEYLSKAIATEFVRALTYKEVLNILEVHSAGGERIETMAGAIISAQRGNK
jgi:hypothetical protein